jgi:hypothetical protein
VDSSPTRLPLSQHGLGLEAEARYVTVGQVSPTAGGIFHQGTAGGGPTYTLRGFGRIRPYAKFIISFAGQNFYVGGAKNYRHDTQMAYAPGGGVDYRVFSHLWARADYEYQIWPNPFSNPNWILDPQGFTVGAAWDLGSMHRH